MQRQLSLLSGCKTLSPFLCTRSDSNQANHAYRCEQGGNSSQVFQNASSPLRPIAACSILPGGIASLIAQGHHRVDSGGATRRNVSTNKRNRTQQQRQGGEHER